MTKLDEKDLKILRGISFGAAIFTLIVALTMLLGIIQLKAMDPLDNPAIVSVKEEFDRDHENAVKAEQVRALDLMARKAYFSSRRQVETGSWLLLAGALVFVVCQRLIAGAARDLPSPPGEKQDQSTVNIKYARYLAGTVAVLTLAAIVSSFVLRSNLPDLSGKALARSEKKEKAKDKKEEAAIASAESFNPDPVNFPFFRGQDGRGIAGGSDYPVEWNAEEGRNIKWKTAVPMNGKSSPVIWGDKLIITGAEGNQCEVYCIDKNTGAILWTAPASGLPGQPDFPPDTDHDTGIAAPTAATDGESVCAIFANGNLVCLDMDGKLKWGKNIGTPANIYGYSCSVIMHDGLLIVQFDSDEKVSMMGFDTANGDLKWETLRRGSSTWASPSIATFNGTTQVLINGNPEVAAFDPATGNELWALEVLSGDVAPSLAMNSRYVYAVTDYARLAAVKPGPGPSIVWEDNMFTSDVSSPVANEQYLFLATGVGDLACYDAVKGDTLWTKYFTDQFYASPIIAGDKLYCLDRSGLMHIVNAGPEYQLIAESPIGEPSDCTPAFSEKNIYIRGRNNIYCISAN
ncbi:MAG: PQQ-binding-like beta-propeller repeat protein [Bacteroidales bacterium]|nr:PQQ-binding-like beta-propeller repeat protein [Bacteroidales bacterium]